ncbi:protein of unknown function DUF1817 [Thalassoporum mexicanum PCC 7367]|uniref:CRR6 family NdhI maturation factor n=1 Tax=Thalassoporum mexicanum TaxID=3457544 RepID=UPI00029FC7B1|nr:CRR6 family NdhI maturation factor [Pseudanabaena sp. PCC 7367]AFY71725.1 protein of unknown function DUF1817 [Pseudanabaena sp. PCC 7367]
MSTVINVNADCIAQIDIAPARVVVDKLLATIATTNGAIATLPEDQAIKFNIMFPQEPTDPRELSEIPEIRLWFIRLDAVYPWLPYYLDWREGELTRYAAMLVPHEFKKAEGIEFNVEAIQIFVMQKVFMIHDWLGQQGSSNTAKLKQMSQALGYEIDAEFFELL